MKNSELIVIKNINKSFPVGDRINTVLKDISFNINKGELITIFGPSGCGKSTLLHIIMGIERPESGCIKIFGIDLWKMNADDRSDMRKRNIGVVYQQQNWIKSLSIIENLALTSQLLGFNKKDSIKKAEESILLVGLNGYRDKYPSELSSGEQQKAGLARAIISNPQVIIADEPTGNLDTKSGYDVLNILQKLVSQGKTVVLVTHNPEYLEHSDRVVIMKDGNILDIVTKTGNTRDIVERKLLEDTPKHTNGNDSPNIKIVEENDYPERSIFTRFQQNISLIIKFFIESTIVFINILLLKFNKGEILDRYVGSKNKKFSKEIGSIYLTELSLKNLFYKKFRTIITILGVGLGTGFVLLLLSLGYGLEKVILDEITEVKDLKQLEVFPKVGSLLTLDQELIEKIKNVPGVEKVYKVKSIPGRINYEGSSTDVVLYGIESGYLEDSSTKKIEGEYIIKTSDNMDIMLNNEYLNVLGLKKDEIVGKKIELEVVKTIPSDETKQEPLSLKIVGIVEDDSPPVAYMKIEEVIKYSTQDYSQATVIIKDDSVIDNVRRQIESLGLESFSIMDTITQVETLFTYVRYGLLLFGIIAFSVAFLGMVNTLVVSLLERTREVGLMKIVGMKKDEIMTIFITESMFIGFLGGLIGIAAGYVGGLFVSLLVYILSISRGVDFVNISYIPCSVVILVVVCTTLLGFFTGLYPAKRAVKIPPLNAMRYE